MAETMGGSPQARGTSRWRRLSLTGTAIGLVFAGLSTTPSLLPRSALEQGAVAGVCFGIGYLVGAALSAVARRYLPAVPRRVSRAAWAVVLVVAAVAAIPVISAYQRTQSALRVPIGGEELTAGDVGIAVAVAVLTAALLVILGKAIASLYAWSIRKLAARWAGLAAPWDRVGPAAASIALIAGGVAIIGIVGVTALAAYTQVQGDAYNASLDPNVTEPSSAYRSAGPDSALSWERAGHEGRRILGTGPSAQDIEDVTGAPATQPIRVYVGLDEPGDWSAHAAAAVAELERMDAADRDVLVVAGTTGKGWLDPQAIDAVEYLNNGDTALVAMQYSDTESWHSFLFHPGAYREATGALVTAVHDWWSALPADRRPRLYLYGLSLGSRAIQDSMADADALRAYGDGAVLAGTPYGTAINEDLTARRDPGSPVAVPVVDGGVRYRWFADALDIPETHGTWESPRVSFLQHGNDPIVWMGPPILWSRPAWLEPGERSREIHPDMQWYPVISAVQGLVDSTEDLAGPDGIGHRYGSMTLEAWLAVAGDGGLAPEVIDAIRQRVIGGDLPAGDGV